MLPHNRDRSYGRLKIIVCGRHCCGRHGFGRHSPPCGRHGLILGPLSFVAVMDLAVIVCGRNGLAVIVLRVAVMDFFGGRYRLWPSWIWPSWSSVWPSWFVAVIVVPQTSRVRQDIVRRNHTCHPSRRLTIRVVA